MQSSRASAYVRATRHAAKAAADGRQATTKKLECVRSRVYQIGLARCEAIRRRDGKILSGVVRQSRREFKKATCEQNCKYRPVIVFDTVMDKRKLSFVGVQQTFLPE